MFPYMQGRINPLRTGIARTGGGGGGFHPYPFDSSEIWYVEYSICTYATIKFFLNKFLVLKGSRPQNGIKI